MPKFLTLKTLLAKFLGLNLGSLPNANPGSGKPWRHESGAMLVGNFTELYYPIATVDAALAGKSSVGHLHDDRYYTESEIAALLANYVLYTGATGNLNLGEHSFSGEALALTNGANKPLRSYRDASYSGWYNGATLYANESIIFGGNIASISVGGTGLNQLNVYTTHVETRGNSGLLVKTADGSAFAGITANAITLQEGAGVVYNTAGVGTWLGYNSSTTHYLRDLTNSRMQVSYIAGVNAAAALTLVHSRLIVDDAATFSGMVNIGDSTTRLFNDSGNLYFESDGAIYLRDTSSGAVNWALLNDGRMYVKDGVWHLSYGDNTERFLYNTSGATNFNDAVNFVGSSRGHGFTSNGQVLWGADQGGNDRGVLTWDTNLAHVYGYHTLQLTGAIGGVTTPGNFGIGGAPADAKLHVDSTTVISTAGYGTTASPIKQILEFRGGSRGYPTGRIWGEDRSANALPRLVLSASSDYVGTFPEDVIIDGATGNVTVGRGKIVVTGSTKLGIKTIATLPSAASSSGERYQVSDSATIVNRIAFSDGSAWYYEGTAVAV